MYPVRSTEFYRSARLDRMLLTQAGVHEHVQLIYHTRLDRMLLTRAGVMNMFC